MTNIIKILVFMSFAIVVAAKHDYDKPFRMQKLNLVWEKASKKLPKEKMKLLHTDLKYQDKEELALKKLKGDGMDKDGLKEAMVQSSFNAILEKYGLKSDFVTLRESAAKVEDDLDPLSHKQMKYVFRDKKLNKLWLKAEHQGFTEEQLNMLKQEFQHHQTKIDQYYEVMDRLNHGSWHKDDPSNNLHQMLEAEEGTKMWKTDESPHQMLKEKHSQLKANYEYLSSKVIPNYLNLEFDEPQVSGLWEMAKNASFTDAELESIRGELHHFEHRIKKYRHLSEQHLKEGSENNIVDADRAKRQKKVKEYEYKVHKIKTEITDRIMERHTEL